MMGQTPDQIIGLFKTTLFAQQRYNLFLSDSPKHCRLQFGLDYAFAIQKNFLPVEGLHDDDASVFALDPPALPRLLATCAVDKDTSSITSQFQIMQLCNDRKH